MTNLIDRRAWMGLLARAPEGAVRRFLDRLAPLPEAVVLRAPEIGAVMVRGRAGATGAPFNLGEMSVTRCALRLGSGEVGHGYVQGRRKDCARAAALVDAMMQTDAADRIRAAILDPIAADLAARAAVRAARAAETRVEFFTLVRGED